jgi:hypothetical protein
MSTASSEETTGPHSFKVGDLVTKKGKQARRGEVKDVKVDTDGKETIKVWWFDQEAESAGWLVASCYFITTLDSFKAGDLLTKKGKQAGRGKVEDVKVDKNGKEKEASLNISSDGNVLQQQSCSPKGVCVWCD